MDTEPFLVSYDGDPHAVGDKECRNGWCGDHYPIPCDCGGLIHADFGDEDWDGYWLHTKCDKCGESE